MSAQRSERLVGFDWPAWRLEVWAADEARWYHGGYMRPSLLGEAVWRGLNL